MLEAICQQTNVSYNWKSPDLVGNFATSTIVINTIPAKPSQTLIANYTLTIRNDYNDCITPTVIPMLQNIYPPKVVISSVVKAISCVTGSVILTNDSDTGIPAGSSFPASKPVIGYMWEGPTPQQPQAMSTTYQGFVPGDYTLTGQDLNNGCTSQTVFNVRNDRVYPSVNSPELPPPFVLDCATGTTVIYPSINGSTANLAFSWSAPSGVPTSDKTKKNMITSAIGVYRIRTTNTINGCATNAEVRVVNDVLTAGMTLSGESGFAPYTVSLNNSSSSLTGTNSIASAWNFGNGTYSITNSALCRQVLFIIQREPTPLR